MKGSYYAPELRLCRFQPSADLWGIGFVLYEAYVHDSEENRFKTRQIEKLGIEYFLPDDLDASIRDALVHLLKVNPQERWNIEQLQAWATSGDATFPEHIDISCRRWVEQGQNKIYPFYQIQIPEEWVHAGEDLKTIKLGKYHMNIAFIDRRGPWYKRWSMQAQSFEYVNKETEDCQAEEPTEFQVIDVPRADTKLQKGDRVFVGVSNEAGSSSKEKYEHVTRIFQQSVSAVPCNIQVLEVMPEFDHFAFPAYCNNAILGSVADACAGQNALDFRNLFRVNVAGVVKAADSTVVWWPGPRHCIQLGDVCLVVRSFDHFRGTSSPTIDDEVRQMVLDERHFRDTLDLNEEATWQAWRRNAKLNQVLGCHLLAMTLRFNPANV